MYTGGELVVEGEPFDIRYKPKEFNGWTQRHWTLPFSGERYSLVFFTPRGCENLAGLVLFSSSVRVGTAARGKSNDTQQEVMGFENDRGEVNLPTGDLLDADRFADRLGEIIYSPDVAPFFRLGSGHRVPMLGFGTFQLKNDPCEAAVQWALDAGFRLIDTASIYKNEEAVGNALKRWEDVDESRRDSVLILSKASTYEMGFDRARSACVATLQRLGRRHLDIYLIHWPAVAKTSHGSPEHRRARHETWRAFEALYREGLVRVIGVSNFTALHLRQLLEDGVEIMPMLNQIEVHPLFFPTETVEFCRTNGILVQAYAPLGGGPLSNAARATSGDANGTRLLLEHAKVLEVAGFHGRTPAQVILRWGIQNGHALVVKSGNPDRISENADIFTFSLTTEQFDSISAIRQEGNGQKFCWDPAAVM